VTGTALKKPVNTRNVQATTMSNGDTDELTARIDRLEHELAKLMSERETALTGWPNEPTIAQGFMAGRWQRRDGDGYDQALVNIPEAPYDTNYYGRYQYTWQPVVEEAPAATSRRSTYGWARASAGSDITWISLDGILANFQPAGNYAPAGDYLDKAGGQMTGPLITRDGGSAANPGLAVGENSTGFYRTGGGQGLLVTTVSGQIVMQLQPVIAAFFIQLDMGANRVSNVGDATADTDALNRRTADARYAPAGVGGGDFLPLSGGNMTGDISMVGTTGPPAMAKLNLYVRGASLAWSEVDNAIVFTKGTGNYPLFVRSNDGSNPQPILDQTLGDARYLQLTQADNLRAKPVVYNVPADIVIPGSGDWTQIANIPCTLPPRPGVTSLLMVSVNCNLKGVNNVAGIGARVPISPTPEQRIFGFGGTVTDPSAGFSVNFFVTPAASVTTLNVAVQLNAFPITGGSPISYTVAGGNVLVLDRSQIVIVDLGPVS
jgi:hypothetical protein